MPDSELPRTAASLPRLGLAGTQALAAWTAARAGVRDVVALSGRLGAGKTAFARAFIHARPGGESVSEVPSPTFTLVQVYDLAPPIWHFDLYRLSRPEDAWELGLEEALADAITLVEWPERLGPLLPRDRLDVELAAGPQAESRDVTVTAHGDWVPRLAGLSPEALRA
ncbi:MAG: tRNA (adenosine(37)-N6)-threonylcarbamoyltransferase complex ATPase subunit type 1 TsaE [Alphaproteobacteria bacterium]|nr:tRNA (adenosine(37)-N6)-threonylcarbamoyltransferase complex ATPase subunit type 1 TsaE [Alphaproteobacteria bacterium]